MTDAECRWCVHEGAWCEGQRPVGPCNLYWLRDDARPPRVTAADWAVLKEIEAKIEEARARRAALWAKYGMGNEGGEKP